MSQTIKTISVEELKQMQDANADFQLIDIREKSEKDIADIGGELIPMGIVILQASKISRDKKVIVYCRSGNRSGRIIAELQHRFGFTNLYNLTGGILAWADKVDPSVKKY
jgi:rhodanese-related sulfurtransferase